jgi:hypothetical protein
MIARKVQFKIYIDSPKDVDVEPMVPVFHDWISKNALGELLIDVTEYGHVHQGPSLLLVGDGSDYAVDFDGGRPGLLYSRKRHGPEDAKANLKDALRRTLFAAKKLEGEASLPKPVRFRTEELLFRINDRLNAPNTAATLASVAPLLQEVLGPVYGGKVLSLAQVGTERDLFSVQVSIKGAPGLGDLLSHLS